MQNRLAAKLAAITVATGLATAGMLGTAGPVNASTCTATNPCSTITTFVVTAGGLSITTPNSTVALATGTVNAGAASASGALGAVSVADTRGALLNGWTATVTTSPFLLSGGTATANETVANTAVAYTSGAATSTSGLGTFVPTLTANTIGTGVTGASWTGAAGNDSAAWNPTITFTLLSSQVAGTYSGTITHSVA